MDALRRKASELQTKVDFAVSRLTAGSLDDDDDLFEAEFQMDSCLKSVRSLCNIVKSIPSEESEATNVADDAGAPASSAKVTTKESNAELQEKKAEKQLSRLSVSDEEKYDVENLVDAFMHDDDDDFDSFHDHDDVPNHVVDDDTDEYDVTNGEGDNDVNDVSNCGFDGESL